MCDLQHKYKRKHKHTHKLYRNTKKTRKEARMCSSFRRRSQRRQRVGNKSLIKMATADAVNSVRYGPFTDADAAKYGS